MLISKWALLYQMAFPKTLFHVKNGKSSFLTWMKSSYLYCFLATLGEQRAGQACEELDTRVPSSAPLINAFAPTSTLLQLVLCLFSKGLLQKAYCSGGDEWMVNELTQSAEEWRGIERWKHFPLNSTWFAWITVKSWTWVVRRICNRHRRSHDRLSLKDLILYLIVLFGNEEIGLWVLLQKQVMEKKINPSSVRMSSRSLGANPCWGTSWVFSTFRTSKFCNFCPWVPWNKKTTTTGLGK